MSTIFVSGLSNIETTERAYLLDRFEQAIDGCGLAALCFYLATGSPYESLRRAIAFASYKIGVAGAAHGFLDAAGLEALHASIAPTPPLP